MELREKLVEVPGRPIVLVVALLCALGIALAAWYGLATRTQGPIASGAVATVGGFPGPDAKDRNERIHQFRQSPPPETTHGH